MNCLKKALAFLLIGASAAFAQTSIPAVTEVEFPGGRDVLKVYSEVGYAGYRNTIGTPALYVTRSGPADSLEAQKWTVTVDRMLDMAVGSSYFKILVTVEGYGVDPTQRILYQDTVDFTATAEQLSVPNLDTKKTITGNLFPFYRDSLWTVHFLADTLLPGDKVEWYFTRYIPAAADSLGRLVTFPRSWNADTALMTASFLYPDSATIFTLDTLDYDNDTTWSTAVSGRMGNINLLIDVDVLNASTTCTFGYGYVVRNRGWSVFAAPLDSGAVKRIKVIRDSVVVNPAVDSVTFANFSIVPADSVKVGIWSKNPTGRIIVEKGIVYYRK